MTKKDIKDIFRAKKVQLNPESIEMIENLLHREVTAMAQRCKEGHFKRLTPDVFHFAVGDWGMVSGPRKFTTK